MKFSRLLTIYFISSEASIFYSALSPFQFFRTLWEISTGNGSILPAKPAAAPRTRYATKYQKGTLYVKPTEAISWMIFLNKIFPLSIKVKDAAGPHHPPHLPFCAVDIYPGVGFKVIFVDSLSFSIVCPYCTSCILSKTGAVSYLFTISPSENREKQQTISIWER